MMIRIAAPGDAQLIAATLLDAFVEFEPLYTPAAFEATTPPTEQIVARFGEGPLWVAELEGMIVGTVSAALHHTEIYIRSMAVSPAARGQFMGTRLLDAVETFAATNGYPRLVLNTTPFLLAALQLYERRGFRPTGDLADLFGTPLIDAGTKEVAVINFDVYGASDAIEMAQLLGEAFSQHDPPAVATGLTAAEFERFVRAALPQGGSRGPDHRGQVRAHGGDDRGRTGRRRCGSAA